MPLYRIINFFAAQKSFYTSAKNSSTTTLYIITICIKYMVIPKIYVKKAVFCEAYHRYKVFDEVLRAYGEEKEQQKIDKLKNFQYIQNIIINFIMILSIFLTIY